MRRFLASLFFIFTFLSNPLFAEELSLSDIEKYAAEGMKEAQLLLGIKYKNGEGVTQDDQQAFRWFRKAAEQGNAEAQYFLSMMYSEGISVAQDYQQAIT